MTFPSSIDGGSCKQCSGECGSEDGMVLEMMKWNGIESWNPLTDTVALLNFEVGMSNAWFKN